MSKFECVQCNKSFTENNYYETKNRLFFPTGKVNVCKSCIRNFIKNESVDEITYILVILDKPFLYDVWEKAVASKENSLGSYLRQLSTLQYRDRVFKDSVFYAPQEKYEQDYNDIGDSEEFAYEITPVMRKRWTGHRNDSDIRFLESYYNDITSEYDDSTLMQRQLYKNIAMTQLEANKALLANQTGVYEKLMNTISKLMGDAKLKPVQETGEDTGGQATWGQWVEKIEQTEPIPDPRPEFVDVDGIFKYVKEWFIDHFARVFDIKRDDHQDEIVGDQ